MDELGILKQQYENFIYPEPTDDIDRDYLKTGRRRASDPVAQYFRLWPEGHSLQGLRVLVAGCGSEQAAILAACNPYAEVIGVDISSASIAYEQGLKRKHHLNNLELIVGDFREVALEGRFDLICCSGVIHHLQNPLVALQSLVARLKDDGVLYLAVYGKNARVTLDPFKRALGYLGIDQDQIGAARVKDLIGRLPDRAPARQFANGFKATTNDAEVIDLFLHRQEQFFDVPEFVQLVKDAGLRIKNWVYPERYAPVYYCPDLALSGALDQAMDLERQWDFADCMEHSLEMHHAYLCKIDTRSPSPAYEEADYSNGYYRIPPGVSWELSQPGQVKVTLRDRTLMFALPGVDEVLARNGCRVGDVTVFREHPETLSVLTRAGVLECASVPFELSREYQLAQADRLREQGNWHGALELLGAVLKQAPESVEAWALMAQTHAEADSLEEAVRAIDKAQSLAPGNAEALRVAAVLALRQRCPEVALGLAEKAAALRPGCAKTLTTLAVVRISQGRLSDAENLLGLADEINPAAEIYANRALLCRLQGRISEAIKQAEEAVKRKPFLYRTWRMLGGLYIETKRYKEAAGALNRVLEHSPDDIQTMCDLGDCFRTLGQMDEALGVLSKAVEQQPGHAASWLNLGATYQAGAETEKAVIAYKRALALNPDQAEVYNNLGCIHKDNRQWHEAVAMFENAVRLQPQRGGFLNNYSIALRYLGRVLDAEMTSRQAVELMPDDFDARSTLGHLYIDEGRIDEAVALLQDMVEPARPESLNCGNLLLIALWLSWDLIKVREILRRYERFNATSGVQAGPNVNAYMAYIRQLTIFVERHPGLFFCKEHGLPVRRLLVFGESHSLSPHHLHLGWLGEDSVARSCFVMGVKMYHLSTERPNHFQLHLAKHIKSASESDHLLFAIGEIDCRPNEGIWKAFNNGKGAIDLLIEKTVIGYIQWIDVQTRMCKPASLTIQGIPAPNYELTGDRDPGDKTAFLEMIRQVNYRLKEEAVAKGWYFLDVYAMTCGDDGRSHGALHIDNFHISPACYLQASQYLRRPD